MTVGRKEGGGGRVTWVGRREEGGRVTVGMKEGEGEGDVGGKEGRGGGREGDHGCVE